MKTVKVYQIYYNEETLKNCFSEKPFFNFLNLTKDVWFENSVIRTLVLNNKHMDSHYFGVVSHKFLKSPDKGRAKGFAPSLLAPFLEKHAPDVLSFFPHMRTGFLFHNRDKEMYCHIFNGLMEHMKLSFRCEQRSDFVVVQNHFITRSAIYGDYVYNYLIPAMGWLGGCKEANSKTLYHGYTFHTFILERLFMAYLNEHNQLKLITWS